MTTQPAVFSLSEEDIDATPSQISSSALSGVGTQLLGATEVAMGKNSGPGAAADHDLAPADEI